MGKIPYLKGVLRVSIQIVPYGGTRVGGLGATPIGVAVFCLFPTSLIPWNVRPPKKHSYLVHSVWRFLQEKPVKTLNRAV